MTWPSTFQANTLGWMIDRIDDELVRSGTLNTQISQCITDAIAIYQRERFRFNETFTTTFSTVGGQQNYNVLADANFPAVVSTKQFYFIEWLTITVPPAVFDMQRIQPEELFILTQTGTQMGQPYAWAYSNENIMLYPIPSTGQGSAGPIGVLGTITGGSGYTDGTYIGQALTGGSGNSAAGTITVTGGSVTNVFLINAGINYISGDVLSWTPQDGLGSGFTIPVLTIANSGLGPYLMTVGGHVTYLAPQSTSELDNHWMTDCEKLIRSRAKYELAINYLRDPDLAVAMSPFPPEFNNGVFGAAADAYEMVKGEANRMQSRGIIRPMSF